MAKNRHIPYGYKIANGKTVVEGQEAETIRKIYSQYAEGLSYKKIAELLTESGIRYMPDKPEWNKNMVARILKNQNYLGTAKYPAILEKGLQKAAKQMAKPYTHTESPDIKMLKPLLFCGVCGEQIRRRLKTSGEERWYCPSDVKHIAVTLTDGAILEETEKLQGYLAENESTIRIRKNTDNQIDIGIIRMQNEIDHALSRTEVNTTELQKTIMELASRKYAFIQDANEGEELKEKIAQLSNSPLDCELIRETITQIQLEHINFIAVILNNGQKIPLQDAEKGEIHLE